MNSLLSLSLLVMLLSSSCMSYNVLDRVQEVQEPQQTAYITNAEDRRAEAKILKHSKRYILVDDSASADVRIELSRLGIAPMRCVTGQATVMFVTLGFYPVRFYEHYFFSYAEIEGDEQRLHEHHVTAEKVVSWFHLFSPKKSRRRVIGKSIRVSAEDAVPSTQ